MTKIQVTAQQRANAIEALTVMWPSVPPENVPFNLSHWRIDGGNPRSNTNKPPTCGTLACFGGWAEWWPTFRPQVKACDNEWDGVTNLFGDENIVNTRYCHLADKRFKGTDHELVTNRLNWLIENSEVVS